MSLFWITIGFAVGEPIAHVFSECLLVGAEKGDEIYVHGEAVCRRKFGLSPMEQISRRAAKLPIDRPGRTDYVVAIGIQGDLCLDCLADVRAQVSAVRSTS